MTRIAHSLDAVIAALEAVIDGRPIPTEAIAPEPVAEPTPPPPAPAPTEPHPLLTDLEQRVKELAEYVAGFVVPTPVQSIGEEAVHDIRARMAEFEQRISDLFKQGSVVPVEDHSARIEQIEQGLTGVFDLARTMLGEMNQKFAEVQAKSAAVDSKLAAYELWMLVIEAQSDPAPTMANHPQAAALLGMTTAQDGDAEAWGAAIKAAKEKRS